MRKWPLIKHYTSNTLFTYIAFVYDLVSTYIEAHELVENTISELKFDEKYLFEIVQESTNNKIEAQRYLEFEINVSFPEIRDSIRTKRAAHNILSF